MDWKDALSKAIGNGLLFSMLYSLFLFHEGFSVAKFIAFAAIFAVLYFIWLMLVPSGKKKK